MDGQRLLKFYYKMYLIRRFEEEAARCYTQRKIGGFLHLYIGQEAVGVGAIEALKTEDYIVTTYRDHGQFLARGGSSRAAMAELFGKETGCAKGRGGSMHFFDTTLNFLGGYGIVGAHVPLATGVAFATKYKKENSVVLCFLGEGAVSIGPFHEALCLAALWKLPIVYIVENNFYAMGTPISRTMATEDASIRALAYPMARKTIESTDVVECHQVAQEAIDRARKESLPMLLEYKTYRYRGHSMADPAKYRTKEEVEEWKKRDPLIVLTSRIEQEFPALVPEIEQIKAKVEQEVADSVEFAENSAEPNPTTIDDFIYV